MGLHNTQWSDAKKEKLMMHLKIYRDHEYKIKRHLDRKRKEAKEAIIIREHEIDKMIKKIKSGGAESESGDEDSEGDKSEKEESQASFAPQDVAQQQVAEYDDDDEDIRNDIQNFQNFDEDEEFEEPKFNVDEEPSFLEKSQQLSTNKSVANNQYIKRIEIDDELLGYNQEVAKYFTLGTNNQKQNQQIQFQQAQKYAQPTQQAEQVKGTQQIKKQLQPAKKISKNVETPKYGKKEKQGKFKDAATFQDVLELQSQVSITSHDGLRDPTQNQSQKQIKNFNNPVFSKPEDQSIQEDFGNVFSDNFDESFTKDFPNFEEKK